MSDAVQDFQQLQAEYSRAVMEMQQLEVQFQESSIVKDEFGRLSSDSKVYKLVGPVLVPQDRDEASTNVAKRLEFISTQKKQAESQIEQLREKMQKAQMAFREQQIKQAVQST